MTADLKNKEIFVGDEAEGAAAVQNGSPGSDGQAHAARLHSQQRHHPVPASRPELILCSAVGLLVASAGQLCDAELRASFPCECCCCMGLRICQCFTVAGRSSSSDHSGHWDTQSKPPPSWAYPLLYKLLQSVLPLLLCETEGRQNRSGSVKPYFELMTLTFVRAPV